MYVIQVMSGKEVDIAKEMQDAGIKALVPIERRLIRSGGSWTYKDYVLFSSYVFLEMSYSAENYYKVKSLPGVFGFLGDPKSPSRLSYLEAEWIMLLTGENNAPLLPSVVRVEDNGEMKVVQGVLEKFESRVIKVDKRSRRATFEITICNEKKEVQLSIELEGEKEKQLVEVASEVGMEAHQPVLQEAT